MNTPQRLKKTGGYENQQKIYSEENHDICCHSDSNEKPQANARLKSSQEG